MEGAQLYVWEWVGMTHSGKQLRSPQSGEQPDCTGGKSGRAGEGGRSRAGLTVQKNSLCLQEGLQGYMPLQAIPNVPSPSCQSLSHNLFQEPLARKPVFLSSLECKFLECMHPVLFIFYSSYTHTLYCARWRLRVDVC